MYKVNPLFERLKQPKGTYESRQPFLEKDFRGLFNADYQEALQNIEVDEQNKVETFSYKKASTHIKEIFPVPL